MGWRSTNRATAPAKTGVGPDGDEHRRHHHLEVARHPHGGDDRVEGEDDVEHRDLDEDRGGEGGAPAPHRLLVADLEAVVDLEGGLGDEEETSRGEQEVAAAHALPEEREEVGGEPHDPGDGEEQRDARGERCEEPEPAGERLAPWRETADDDGEEHDVVEPEDDLHRRQGREARPGLRLSPDVEHAPVLPEPGPRCRAAEPSLGQAKAVLVAVEVVHHLAAGLEHLDVAIASRQVAPCRRRGKVASGSVRGSRRPRCSLCAKLIPALLNKVSRRVDHLCGGW